MRPILTLFRGEYRRVLVRIVDRRTREPLVLALGSQLVLTVRARLDNVADAGLLELRTGQGIEHANQTTNPGEATITFTSDMTEVPADSTLMADLWFVDPLGNAQIVIEPSPILIRQPVRRTA